jgi:NAD+ kinase
MRQQVRRIGVVANCTKSRAPVVLARILKKARAAGIRVVADPDTASLAAGIPAVPASGLSQACDVILALGGDGTLLRAVRELGDSHVPILGVNIGHLGFLTAISERDVERAMDDLAAGRYRLGRRPLLGGMVRRHSRPVVRCRALNDLVIRTGASSRMVTLDVAIDGVNVSSYYCDGLIVATPSGSTGHSLSAGGPILSPDTKAIVISLICPHTMSSRPLVLPDKSAIAVTVAHAAGDVILSVDGQIGHALSEGDHVTVKRSAPHAAFVYLHGYDWFAVLRRKLKWSGRHV